MPAITDERSAREWITTLPHVSRETLDLLERYAAMLVSENERQNLIARSTVDPDILWSRHIGDSAQLVALGGIATGRWIDLGSGPGLPGLVVAILAPALHVTLVESRKRRCAFLNECLEALGLSDRVAVVESRVERVESTVPFDVISARAFAPLELLMATARHLAGDDTLWLLPKGQNAAKELSSAPASWHKMFHVEPSLTDAEAGIIMGRGLPPLMQRQMLGKPLHKSQRAKG